MEFEEWIWRDRHILPGISAWENMAAFLSEEEIERKPKDGATVRALRWIDERTERGTLERDIANLRIKFADWGVYRYFDPFESVGEAFQRLELSGWNKLHYGCHSPDKEERERYIAARNWIRQHHGDSTPEALGPILAIIEAPRHRSGRPPRGIPTPADFEKLALMKPLVQNGMKVSAAAREVASRGEGQSEDAVRKRLERWWRWKADLRSFPPEFGT